MDITLESESTEGAKLSGSNTGHMAKATLVICFFVRKRRCFYDRTLIHSNKQSNVSREIS